MGRILVLGGYGGFGARLSRRLGVQGHTVLVAGRNRAAAEALCRTIPGAEVVVADRAGDLRALLEATRPDLVIDAAGPFQGSGYEVPRACIEAELARGSLVALATEEERPPESFWLAWKTGAEGRALQWWRDRLQRPLVPALLPRAG